MSTMKNVLAGALLVAACGIVSPSAVAQGVSNQEAVPLVKKAPIYNCSSAQGCVIMTCKDSGGNPVCTFWFCSGPTGCHVIATGTNPWGGHTAAVGANDKE